MADEPKIVFDPPPIEPHDVPTNVSPPPAAPFDVKTYPDLPPAGTFDVSVSYDGQLPGPFDVAVNRDSQPALPFNVSTTPDMGPLSPIDVVTSPDAGPAVPMNVSVTPDTSPGAVIDVAVVNDTPPSIPFNVDVSLDRPPAIPFDVSIELSQPPVMLTGISGDRPVISEIIAAVKSLDAPLGAFLSGLVQINPISVSVAGGGALDPTVLAAWFRDYTNSVGPSGVSKFIAEQSMLYAMNPVVARIFDPTYFFKMMSPYSMGHARTTLDTESGVTAETIALARDVVLRGKVSSNPGRPGGNGLSERPDVYGPENSMNNGQDFSIDEMVDAAVDGAAHPYMSPDKNMSGLIPVKRFDAAKYFEDRRHDGAMFVRSSVKQRAASGAENIQSREAALVASNFLDGVVRVPVGPNEDPDGAVYSHNQNPGEIVDDDDARVPLSFTDLRKDAVRNAYRSVYFRPLNLNFSKSVSPEWAEGSSFGRTDPIVGYQRTSRTYSVSFEMHAFAPEDLAVMYNKMIWLESMCYPSYGSDSLMKSGPVIRLRIGDAVSTESGGLSGVIKSLNFDFADALWELKKGMKVPKSFKVSLEFLALHEGPVGTVNGTFGVFQLPPGQTSGDTDNRGQSNSRDSVPTTATILPGRYARFGEPRR